MRNRFIDTIIRHPTEGIVDTQQIQHFRRPNPSRFVDPGHCHGQIDVMGAVIIPIVPGGIGPPGIMDIKTEHKIIPRQIADPSHMSHQFNAEISVQRCPG